MRSEDRELIEGLLRQGLAWQQAERRAEAADAYRKVLSADPANVDALHLLGILTHQMGDSPGGARLIAEAVRLAPRIEVFRLNQALVLHAMKDHTGAAEAYRAAAGLAPGNVSAWRGWGLELIAAGRHAEAIEPLQRALALAPKDVLVLNGLGNALGRLERFAEALPYLQSAEGIKSDARTRRNIGVMLHRMGRLPEARDVLERLTTEFTQSAEYLDLLGLVLTDQADLSGAWQAFAWAVERAPDEPQPLLDLANATSNLGRPTEASALYRKLLWRWPRADGWSNLCMNELYRDDVAESDVVATHREAAAFFDGVGARVVEAAGMGPMPARVPIEVGARPLRVGYLSPDFYRHPVSQFLLPVLEHHDPTAVHAIGISTGMRIDAVTTRVRSHCREWYEIRQVDDATALRRLRDARLDVLVDLAGHTGFNRLGLIAARLAPVQVSYLGYAIGTGVLAIDGRIGDPVADSAGDDSAGDDSAGDDGNAEPGVTRLERTMWCYEPSPGGPDVVHRDQQNVGVVFGSFNNWLKATPSTIAAWGEILRRVPESRLVLKSGALADEGVRRAAFAAFESTGVDAARITLRGKIVDTTEHLTAYSELDIALDPWPYNGTTTTCDALWMGVPVVTLAGRAHRSRVGAGLLTAVGLADLIADCPEKYIALAVELARDARRRSELRMSLRDRIRASALCDGAGLASALEAVYRRLVGAVPVGGV